MNKKIYVLKNYLENSLKLGRSATIEKEEINILLNVLYKYINFHESAFSSHMEKTYEAIEKALGFDLFIWQKTYIERGIMRKYGKTTAEILRALLDVESAPIDFSFPPKSNLEKIYRKELYEIKCKLTNAGIQTRIVFWNIADKIRFNKFHRQNSQVQTRNQSARQEGKTWLI